MKYSGIFLWYYAWTKSVPFPDIPSNSLLSLILVSVAYLLFCFLFCFLTEELVPRGPRPARPGSVPASDTRDRADSGSLSISPGKGMKSIKEKLMTRPKVRSRVDYDELAQVS